MRARANGIDLYYERAGKGAPLLLLHGNGEDHTIFRETIPLLAQGWEVIAPDSRGHGQSEAAPLHYADMARDVAALIHVLGLPNPILCGFSDGGIVGLELALRYPGLLRGLILCGANADPAGLCFTSRAAMRVGYWFTRDPKLRLMLTEPNLTAADLHALTTPTLVLAGQRDLIRPAHTRYLAAQLPNARLRILPGETHGSYVIHSEKLASIILPFLRELART